MESTVKEAMIRGPGIINGSSCKQRTVAKNCSKGSNSKGSNSKGSNKIKSIAKPQNGRFAKWTIIRSALSPHCSKLTFMHFSKYLSIFLAILFCLQSFCLSAPAIASATNKKEENNKVKIEKELESIFIGNPKPQSKEFTESITISSSDIKSDLLSLEAIDLAKQLGVIDKISRICELQRKIKEFPGTPEDKAYTELKSELRELKQEVLEVIEESRLEIEYVRAELRVENALHKELIESYSDNRDEKVYKSNVWGFRTNGVLWAVAEALTIPTYRNPRLAIPSGATGILAGLVPTAFSILALREAKGGRFDRKPHPNMLSKIFDYPASPRVDYPQSVWTYLHSIPPHAKEQKLTRIDILINQWIEDKNIKYFSDRHSKSQLDLITGSVQHRVSIGLLNDRANMLAELDALICLMHRPLLELMMALRGKKHLPIAATIEPLNQ